MVGNDNNNGNSLSLAFATIQKAHDVSNPGDIINVADGNYTADIIISRSGTANKWITYKSINKYGATLTNNWGAVFSIGSSSNLNVCYIILDGFDLKATGTYGNGVASDYGAHHITVKNCWAHDCGASGMQLNHGDYILAENNVCNGNSVLFDNLCGSGISIYGKKRVDTNSGFHIILRGNTCYMNMNGPKSPKSDGNGIIIDDLRCTQSYHSGYGTPIDINYTDYAVLIENNLCYGNEGAGVQVYLSNNVTVRNNTVYNNQLRKTNDTWRGDLSVSCAANIIFANNISVTNTSLRADGGSSDWLGYQYNCAIGAFALTGNEYGSNYSFYNNITYNVNNTSSNSIKTDGITVSIVGVNGNNCAVNPQFITPGILNSFNFHLQSTSAAINSGTSAYGLPTSDLDGLARVQGSFVDIGCYEYIYTTLNVTANSSANSVCEGSLITLTGSGASSYTWSGGVYNGVSFKPTITKTYTVTGSDETGATGTNTITIYVNTLPSVTANASNTTICNGENVILSGSGASTYSWTGGVINGISFTPITTQTYTVTGIDGNNCSNIDKITINVTPLLNLATTSNGDTIEANQSGATYKWLNCTNGNSTIAGEISQQYITSITGNYAVIVSQNGCSDTSLCTNISIVGLNEISKNSLLKIYPNPNSGSFYIESASEGNYSIINEFGQDIRQIKLNSANKYIMNIDNLNKGIYLIVEFTNHQAIKQKIVVEK
jgi:hypothetical protein